MKAERIRAKYSFEADWQGYYAYSVSFWEQWQKYYGTGRIVPIKRDRKRLEKLFKLLQKGY